MQASSSSGVPCRLVAAVVYRAGDTDLEVQRKTVGRNFDFHPTHWSHISAAAKDFVGAPGRAKASAGLSAWMSVYAVGVPRHTSLANKLM